jgi:hypothetical protein
VERAMSVRKLKDWAHVLHTFSHDVEQRERVKRIAPELVPVADRSMAGMSRSDAEGGMGEAMRAIDAWRRCGFPTIEPSARLTASLMSTSLRGIDDVRFPWEAFAIIVPTGLLNAEDTDGTRFAVTSVLVQSVNGSVEVNVCGSVPVSRDQQEREDDAVAKLLAERRPRSVAETEELARLYHPATTVAELLGDPDDLHEANPRTADKDDLGPTNARILALVGRLVIGCALEMATVSTKGSPPGVRSEKSRRSGEPRLWVFKLTRDVKIDVRAAVTAYVAGGGRSPTVQSLVRGHWKNQPHGPRSSLRKWIHVEPFWRGPEDAPIAVRSHVLRGEP